MCLAALVCLLGCDRVGFGPSGNALDLLLKSQSVTSWFDGVLEVWYFPADEEITVGTYTPTQGWRERGVLTGVTFANGDRFGARALCTGRVEVFKNDARVGTVNVSAWPLCDAEGYLGLWFVAADHTVVDDFGGGTIEPGTP